MNQPNLTNQNKVAFNPFTGPAIESVLNITPSQSEIWIACKLGGNDANRAYNESVTLVLKGELDENAIEFAIQTLVQRHDSLRATFSADGRFMTIFKELPIKLKFQDFSNFTSAEKDKTITNYLSQDVNYIFDLVKGPLFKVGLIKVAEQEHYLILTAHHIICDGWSFGIILEELGSLYAARKLNKDHTLPEPEKFSAFADRHLELVVSEEYKKTEQFWLQQYETSIPQVNLPTDFPRPQLRTYKSDRLDFRIDNDLVTAIKKVGIKSGCSFVNTLMVAFELFLYRQTGQIDLVLGLPSAGQAVSGKTQLIGHCVNLLPLRSKIFVNTSFNDYLKIRKTALFDAYDHQELSFGQLLQKLPFARDPSRIPLVPVVFNIDMGMADDVSFGDLNYKLKSNPRAFEAFEIFLNITGSANDLILEWSYNSSLFKPETIKKMMVSFEEIVNRIVGQPDDLIRNIVQKYYSAYQNLNETEISYPHLPLHELLTKQAQISSKKTAIKFDKAVMSYSGLEQQINQLSHYFSERGLRPGTIVGVALPRSIELVVTLIAIMKCGAAYMPLDPNYPRKRLEFMLKDSEANFLIASKSFSLSNASSSKLLLFEDLFINLSKYPITPFNLKVNINEIAYLLYTSGSTGNPKGVPITHKSLVNFLYSMSREPGINETDKLLSITTISFDIAGLELFLPLCTGATLILTDDETAKDTRLMLDLLKNESITILQATPSTWQMLIDSGWDKPLSIKALCGGEALPMALAKKILHRVDELWNVYGPTETTIWSTLKQIKTEDEIITIGHPIANTQLYILNEQGLLVPPGTQGELCIAGDGLAKGYWKRPDLTDEKFIVNTFDSDKSPKLYRTGDLAQLLPNGEILCLGRIDQQIKIRGHRIELGEIEKALDSLEGVQASVVLLNADRLIANLILHQTVIQTNNNFDNWKRILAEKLPAHMVPQEFNVLDEFPKTLNGKTDRKALLASLSVKMTSTSYTAPRNKTEQLVATVWQACLAVDSIDIHSDFFELGGHSLIAVKVMALLEKQTGVKLPLAALLEQPTIKRLATYIDKRNITWDSLVPLKRKGNKAPLFIVHGANYNILIFKSLAKNLDDEQPVYALQAKGLSGAVEPHDSVEEMASHYISEIKSINPKGPYMLAGFSFGGIIAFEMAKQLKARGEIVKNLALFDCYVYPHYYYSNPILKKVISKLYSSGQLVFMVFNMFSSVKNFERRTDLLKLKISGLFLKLKYGTEKQQQLQFNRSSKIDDMHKLAYNRYNITPQDIKVDLFRSTENIYYAHDYKYLGWKKIASGGICKHMISGNHSEMFLSPAVEELAPTLQNILDK